MPQVLPPSYHRSFSKCLSPVSSSPDIIVSFSKTNGSRGGAAGPDSDHGLPADLARAAGAGAGDRTGRCQEGPKVSGPRT